MTGRRYDFTRGTLNLDSIARSKGCSTDVCLVSISSVSLQHIIVPSEVHPQYPSCDTCCPRRTAHLIGSNHSTAALYLTDPKPQKSFITRAQDIDDPTSEPRRPFRPFRAGHGRIDWPNRGCLGVRRTPFHVILSPLHTVSALHVVHLGCLAAVIPSLRPQHWSGCD